MAIVGSVYSSARNIRTPEEVIKSLFAKKQSTDDKEPRIRPLNKRVRASLTRTENTQEINATEEIFN